MERQEWELVLPQSLMGPLHQSLEWPLRISLELLDA